VTRAENYIQVVLTNLHKMKSAPIATKPRKTVAEFAAKANKEENKLLLPESVEPDLHKKFTGLSQLPALNPMGASCRADSSAKKFHGLSLDHVEKLYLPPLSR
jgi:hypothetical protein